ncbi:hypothetical protein Patl1_07210 [Pistacia atlantica]|uniref:Uncharacterized protein n=2 Tax=Pistacia atlantica TaxID=434234 RepID=A0ACC1AF57_9ROSI|nr:hypothetical protein Patl1_07210 [Pistacia atlantica]
MRLHRNIHNIPSNGQILNADSGCCARLKMANVVVGGSFGDSQKNVFDLGAFVGDLTFEEDASG